tara:strand:- start:29249 stop:30055 length:807 start_codon:yes stop_codon:yes gene_type:complete
VTTIPLTASDAQQIFTAKTSNTRWFEQLQLWRPEAVDELTTGDGETAVILLAGTFDLMAGTNTWPARGARKSPFAGRAMAVFLPPNTPFRVGNEACDGEILMISARQPESGPDPVGKEALSQKPLLPMAGSNKSFDPITGEWLLAEAFPNAAESLPPRRFEKLRVGDIAIDRIFQESYKAATISLDEIVIPAGASLSLKDIPSRPACDEVLLFVRPESKSRIEQSGTATEIEQDSTHCMSAADANQITVHSEAARTYLVIAYAGKTKR